MAAQLLPGTLGQAVDHRLAQAVDLSRFDVQNEAAMRTGVGLKAGSGHANGDLLQRITAIDKESALLDQRLPYAAKCDATSRRMAAVQSADPDGERKIIGALVVGEDKILDGNAAELHSS